MRARWVKPEFFKSRVIGKLGPVPALVLIALWCIADDGGVAMCDPARIKGEMFLFWNAIEHQDIEDAISALADAGLIELYTIADEGYAEIANWSKRQVHMPSSFRHPRRTPADGLAQPCITPDGVLPQGSPPRHLDTQTPTSVAEAGDPQAKEAPASSLTRINKSSAQFEEFWRIYPTRAGGENKQGALRWWKTRLGEGVPPELLIERARIYCSWCTAEKIVGTAKVMMASTFLGRDRRYEDDYTVPALKLEPGRRTAPLAQAAPYSREWLQKNGYSVAPVESEEVA